MMDEKYIVSIETDILIDVFNEIYDLFMYAQRNGYAYNAVSNISMSELKNTFLSFLGRNIVKRLTESEELVV